jgi:Ribonuclease G/E
VEWESVLDELKRLRAVNQSKSPTADGEGESTAGYASIHRDLRSQASRLLELTAGERTPELMRRALVHIEQAMRLTDNADIESLRVQAEARYRNGQYSAALEPLRKAESRRDEVAEGDAGQHAKTHALIAMTEAKHVRQHEAKAALANYRRLWAEANPKVTTPPPLLIEVEQT